MKLLGFRIVIDHYKGRELNAHSKKRKHPLWKVNALNMRRMPLSHVGFDFVLGGVVIFFKGLHNCLLGSVKKFVSLEENDSFLVRITI